MYTIKRTSGTTIYDPAQQESRPVLNPKMSETLNEAGSLTFTMVYGHPKFDSLMPMEDYIQAFDDGEEIFYGRVVDRSDPLMDGQVQIQCAGALSFLQDSEVKPGDNASVTVEKTVPKAESSDYEEIDGAVVEPIPGDDKRVKVTYKIVNGTTNKYQMTPREFFAWCIGCHNEDMGNDSRRKFTVGTVNVSDTSTKKSFAISSYTTTKSAIESNLINVYGGFLRVRPDGNGGHYIDWVKSYGMKNKAPIELGNNVIDITRSMSSDDFFTAVRPVGKNNLMLSEKILDVFDSSAMRSYGRIIKTVSFNDATKEDDLRTKANEYIDRLKKTFPIEAEVHLVDLHYVDGSKTKIRLGFSFTNIHGLEGTTMTVSSLETDFENPANDSMTLMNERSLSSGKAKSTGSISSASSRARASSGLNLKYIHELDNQVQINTARIDIQASDIMNINANILRETYNLRIGLSRRIDSVENDVGILQGTAVIQDSEHIAQIAGQFIMDETTGELQLIDGTQFTIDADGARITVGTLLSSLDDSVQAFEGSALWTERDHITGVTGIYEIDEDGNLIIKEGSGLFMTRNGAQFGVYDEGNLTGGIMVEKINDETETFIAGDRIYLGKNKTDVQTLQEALLKAGLIDEDTLKPGAVIVNQLVANEVYAAKVTAIDAEINNLKTDKLSTNQLKAAFSNISLVNFQSMAGTTSSSQINCGSYYGNNYYVNVPGGGGSVSYVNLAESVAHASITLSGNTYTLHLYKGTGTEIAAREGDVRTFSRATTLTGSWSGGVFPYTITASPQGNTHSIGFGQNNDVNLTLGTNGSPTLNKNNSKYVDAPLRIMQTVPNGSGGSTTVNRYTATLGIDATPAWEAGWINAAGNTSFPGYTAPADLTASFEVSAPIYREKTPGNWVREKLTKTFTLSKGTSSTSTKVGVSDGANTMATIAIGDVYTAGWKAAYDKVNVDGYFPSTQPSTITQSIYTAKVNPTVDGDRINYQYYITSGDDIAYIRYGSTSGEVVAQVNHGKYTAGWKAAYDKVNVDGYFPSTKPSTITQSIYTAKVNPTVDGDRINYQYYITSGDDIAYIRYGSTSGAVVAQVNHGKYTAGKTQGAKEVRDSIVSFFGVDNGNYYIGAKETGGSSALHSIGYKLYLTSGDYVQIHNTNGSRIADTPQLHVSTTPSVSQSYGGDESANNASHTVTVNGTPYKGEFHAYVDNSYAYVISPDGNRRARLSHSVFQNGKDAAWNDCGVTCSGTVISRSSNSSIKGYKIILDPGTVDTSAYGDGYGKQKIIVYARDSANDGASLNEIDSKTIASFRDGFQAGRNAAYLDGPTSINKNGSKSFKVKGPKTDGTGEKTVQTVTVTISVHPYGYDLKCTSASKDSNNNVDHTFTLTTDEAHAFSSGKTYTFYRDG